MLRRMRPCRLRSVPGGMTVPLLATGVIIWLLTGLTKPEFIGIAIFISVFSLIYLLTKRIKKNA